MKQEYLFKNYSCKKITQDDISNTEIKLGYKFPVLFKELALQCDGGVPIKSNYTYYDPEDDDIWENGIGCYLSLKWDREFSLHHKHHHHPKDFPKDIVAFADTAGGDYLSFDYRCNRYSDNPPIVFWIRTKYENDGLIFLANTFEEFLKMLKEPED